LLLPVPHGIGSKELIPNLSTDVLALKLVGHHFWSVKTPVSLANIHARRNMDQNKHPNDLIVYRLRMGFSRKYVAGLLRHKNSSLVSKLELGHALPSLETALKLATIYRIPVDFLYSDLYRGLRQQIRSRESRLRAPQQATLF